MGLVECIKNVVKCVVKWYQVGYQMVVVLLVMFGEINCLFGFVKEILSQLSLCEFDMIVLIGEQVSVGLLLIVLQEIGVEVVSYVGW